MEFVVLDFRVAGTGYGTRYHYYIKQQNQPNSKAKWIQLSQLSSKQREAVANFLATSTNATVPSTMRAVVEEIRQNYATKICILDKTTTLPPFNNQHNICEETVSSFENNNNTYTEVYIKSPAIIPLLPLLPVANQGIPKSANLFNNSCIATSTVANAISSIFSPSNKIGTTENLSLLTFKHQQQPIKQVIPFNINLRKENSPQNNINASQNSLVLSTDSSTSLSSTLSLLPQHTTLFQSSKKLNSSINSYVYQAPTLQLQHNIFLPGFPVTQNSNTTIFPTVAYTKAPAYSRQFLKNLIKQKTQKFTQSPANPFFP